MSKKKSYSIDPKEYERDGLFYEDESLSCENDPHEPMRKESPRTYESPRAEVRRLRREAFFIRRRLQKLEAFRKRVEAYDGHYIVDLSTIEYVRVYNPYGCKEAFTDLQKDLESATDCGGQGKFADYSVMDTMGLRVAKSYFIYSPNPYAEIDLLLEDLPKCRLERLGYRRYSRTTVGCLLLNGDEFVFFWPKQLHNQDVETDIETDIESEGF